MKLAPNLTKTLDSETCGATERETRFNKKSPSQPTKAALLIFAGLVISPMWFIPHYGFGEPDYSPYVSIAIITPTYFLLKFAFCRWLQHKDRQPADGVHPP